MSLPKSIATVHSILMIVINVCFMIRIIGIVLVFSLVVLCRGRVTCQMNYWDTNQGPKRTKSFDKLILLKGFSGPRQKNHWPGAWVSSEYNWSDRQAGKEKYISISIYNQMVRGKHYI